MAEERPEGWVDFAAANSVPFGRVVSALGLEVKRTSGTQWQGVCPLHEQKGEGKRESFGFNEAKGVFNCFACKKSGDLIRLVTHAKGIGAKEAAAWLVSLVDNGEVQESVQVEAAGVQTPEVQEKAALGAESMHTSEGLTAREQLLVAMMTRGVAVVMAEVFASMSDVSTIEARLREAVRDQELFFCNGDQTNDR